MRQVGIWPVIALAAAAAAGGLTVRQAAATYTQTSTVKLAVAGTCAVSSGGDLSFGTPAMTIDGTSARTVGNTDASSTLLVTCSPQLPYQVYSVPSSYATGSGDSAVRRMRATNSSGWILTVAYSISSVSSGGTNFPTSSSSAAILSRTGTGAQETISYYGRIAGGTTIQTTVGTEFAYPFPAQYSDTLTFTVNY